MNRAISPLKLVIILIVLTGLIMAVWPFEAISVEERDKYHAVYLRDSAGDCVAIWGIDLDIPNRAAIQHVASELCK